MDTKLSGKQNTLYQHTVKIESTVYGIENQADYTVDSLLFSFISKDNTEINTADRILQYVPIEVFMAAHGQVKTVGTSTYHSVAGLIRTVDPLSHYNVLRIWYDTINTYKWILRSDTNPNFYTNYTITDIVVEVGYTG